MLRTAFAPLAVTVALLAGCGGDDEPTAPPAGGGAANGAEIFTSSCASCHALAAADADGKVGPNLDTLEPDEQRVENKVRRGGGGMPSFDGSLTDEQISAVASYVATNAGG